MFTGIIEELGKVKSFNNQNLTISANTVLEDIKLGDSIAINGCCQTVVDFGSDFFSVNVSFETLNASNFKYIKVGDIVNLERALTLKSRLGGHIVQGHVEGVGILTDVKKSGEFYNLYFSYPKEFDKYIVNKGSIAVNGISLTVASVSNLCFSVAVIPHTFNSTNLKYLNTDDKINLETDIIGKYVEKFLSSADNDVIDEKFLAENGFI